MGRQIGFFMIDKDISEFLDFVLSDCNVVPLIPVQPTKEYVMYDRKYDLMNGNEGSQIYFWHKFISPPPIVEPLSGKNPKRRFFIDLLKSEVIEFDRSWKLEKTISGSGRIFIPSSHYDEHSNLVKRGEQFIKWYESLARWIKKQSVGKRKNEFRVNLYVMKEAANFFTAHEKEVIFKK